MSARYSNPSLRELTNANSTVSFSTSDVKASINSSRGSNTSLAMSFTSNAFDRLGAGSVASLPPPTARLSSPHADRRNRHSPRQFTDMIGEITEMFFETEKQVPKFRDASYLDRQAEVTEKMRAIVVDWLVDVQLKFRLHAETFFLTVDIMDRFLSAASTTRAQFQLVGITSMLLAAKYEEMYAPDVRECIKITANTYTRDEILRMERSIAETLRFRFTVPTPYPFLVRLLQVINADSTTQHAANFFLEHAVMDYKSLQYLPSQIAAASVFLAMALKHRTPVWSPELQYYSHRSATDVLPVAEAVLAYCRHVTGAKYQAIRRKYSSSKYGEITQRPLPESLTIS